MAASFNNSAGFYDFLSRLVYGKAIINTQLYLIDHIRPNNNILIVGGGTGWILDEITKLHPTGLKITYVEAAKRMMQLSKKRNTGGNEIVFINDVIEGVNLPAGFDVVITPFLFDNFTEGTLNRVFNKIHTLLKPNGLWLNCDFQLKGKCWQAFLLKSMFLFFRLIDGIEANKLPEIEACFNRNNYSPKSERTFFGDFIVARVYRK
ncbi:class I SAM-dependent methyltransferase [Mucilaginibacter ginsenosidivorax]|uniref:Class I SAM-dependent methyltransferase n=1 Tax=Mucilaginibacter ginsenosidivorax TaxID=862126 RepID=A0A5B8VWH8_9SPHI|nr:class I SAM-dependent methyltransferase [Mucilaginibacter ginsenosidivorax]QEC76054.1 class I SAM-dependent methyltransferase [Mucilaginibacter ginsenosidivorax]